MCRSIALRKSVAPGKMTPKHYIILAVMLGCAIGGWGPEAGGQTAPCVTRQPSAQMERAPVQSAGGSSVGPAILPLENALPSRTPATPEVPCGPQPLFAVRDADVKFRLETLMSMLRDSRHESWVLAAYPDPKTSRPLIGAGFSLDVEIGRASCRERV